MLEPKKQALHNEEKARENYAPRLFEYESKWLENEI